MLNQNDFALPQILVLPYAYDTTTPYAHDPPSLSPAFRLQRPLVNHTLIIIVAGRQAQAARTCTRAAATHIAACGVGPRYLPYHDLLHCRTFKVTVRVEQKTQQLSLPVAATTIAAPLLLQLLDPPFCLWTSPSSSLFSLLSEAAAVRVLLLAFFSVLVFQFQPPSQQQQQLARQQAQQQAQQQQSYSSSRSYSSGS
ncbi:unnamed protein product [Tilletia controversa]|nr:unnamed protein product [Tilletia controversa]